MIRRLIFLVVLSFITACSSVPSSNSGNMIHAPVQQSDSAQYKRFMGFYSQWEGTPYKYGGMSRSGVDCSGFMVRSFDHVYNVKLPRTTELQMQRGKVIERGQLQTGDLIFFKTGIKKLHVGVYLKDSKFMHASTSKGVIVSTLNNPYWTDAYWHGRRVID